MKDIPETAKSSLQQWAKIIAMKVRNRMEDFHSEHLDDDQMKELNPIIRNAIFEALRYLYLIKHAEQESQRVLGLMEIGTLLSYVPDYWETPNLSEEKLEQLRLLSDSDLFTMPWFASQQAKEELAEFCRDDLGVFHGGMVVEMQLKK